MALNSCVNSNHVLSDSIIQKRKYNKGWFFKRTVEPKTNSANLRDNKLGKNSTVDHEVAVTSNSSYSNDLTNTPSNNKQTEPSHVDNEITSSTVVESNNHSYSESKFKFSRKLPSEISYNKKPDLSVKNSVPNELSKKRQEPFGIIGLILGVSTVLAIIIILGSALEIGPLTIIALAAGLISLIFGIISLIRIMRNQESFKGKGVAIASTIVGGLLLFFGGVLLFLWLAFTF